MSYSHMGTPTLPSAQLRFTSEFGMGSGGTTMLLSLDKNFVHGCTYVAMPWMAKSNVSVHACLIILKADVVVLSTAKNTILIQCSRKYVMYMQCTYISYTKPLGCCMVKPHGQLVSVSSRPHSPYTPDLSTL